MFAVLDIVTFNAKICHMTVTNEDHLYQIIGG